MNLTGHNRRLRIKSYLPAPAGNLDHGAGSGNAAAPDPHDGEGRGGFLSCNLVEVKNEREFLIAVL
uniref:hypothetical protein n=1 Tax=Candidatus Fimivicinus sp. TaxID=3056640 RepID=UPI003FEFB761